MFNPFVRKARGPTQEQPGEKYELGGITDFMRNTSVFSFEGGVLDLPSAILAYLQNAPNVEVINNSVLSLSLRESSSDLSIKTSQSDYHLSNVVSTVPLPALAKITPKESHLPHLTANPMSSVTVVNLIFDAPADKIHPPGFGYLIPRSKGPEVERLQPLERAMLGTVFDSSALSAQDSSPALTKITVMLGGPHGAPKAEDIDIPQLISILSSHLSRPLPQPKAFKIHHQKDCIPTPTVGHLQRMGELKAALHSSPWNGRLNVVGAGVGGVSVGDCIESGRRAALELCQV